MPNGPGFWLDPHHDRLYRVRTHNDWLLDAHNQAAVGLGPESIRVLARLDPTTQIDHIRMVGVIAGLVRIRVYRDAVHIQFFASDDQVARILQSVADALPRVTTDQFVRLRIQNLRDDSTATLPLPELRHTLQAQQAVLEPADPIAYNIWLRREACGFLGDGRL